MNEYIDFDQCCCTKPDAAAAIPVVRIREKLDALVNRKDYGGAARLLEYWLAEARTGRDDRGEFVVLNEMMGVYRKMGDGPKALAAADAALALIPVLENAETLSAGTAYVNAGTVCDCFGDPETALTHFEAARRIYESCLDDSDDRLGALYNNMALALSDLARYDEAGRYFSLALDVMGRRLTGQLEQAITWLNMADAAEAAQGPEEAEETISDCLGKAEALLSDPAIPHNGYYAFVAEKCAPAFEHHGWFATASALRREAEAIYMENERKAEDEAP